MPKGARIVERDARGRIAAVQKKKGRARRGFTIRFQSAEDEVRFNKYVEEFKGTQPEALGQIIHDYLKNTY